MRTPVPNPSADAHPSRARALAVVTDLLGLRPARPGDDPARTLGLVGSAAEPRYLVPLGWPAAATASCLAYLRLRPTRTQVQRGLVGRLVGGAGAGLVVRARFVADTGPGSLLARVAELIGEAPLAAGVGLGVADAVWKPTLQVFRPDGTPLAFVKIGWNEVTTALVRNEAAALDAVAASRSRLVVPSLLACSTWEGRTLTVVAPLPADVRRLPPGTNPSPLPVRDLDGPVEVRPVFTSTWWEEIDATLTAADEDHAGRELRKACVQVRDRYGALEAPVGRWHGDWVPWNLARCSAGLAVWDWEYSEPQVPVGLDEAHAAFQRELVGAGRPPATAFAAAEAAARAGRDPAPAVADLHALAVAARLLRQVAAGAPPTPLRPVLTSAAAAVLARP
ncbi:MAG: hypothetical protein JWN46_3695 [Acidimicrobiales bacterium]|nr:hypothetical protein [Acidimicrobiales bacterium]